MIELILFLAGFGMSPNLRRRGGLIRTRRHTIASGLGTIAGGEEAAPAPTGDPTELQFNNAENAFYLAII